MSSLRFTKLLVVQVAGVDDCPPNWSIIQRIQDPTMTYGELNTKICSIDGNEEAATSDAGWPVPKPQHSELAAEAIAASSSTPATRPQPQAQTAASTPAQSISLEAPEQAAVRRAWCVDQPDPQNLSAQRFSAPAPRDPRQCQPQVSEHSLYVLVLLCCVGSTVKVPLQRPGAAVVARQRLCSQNSSISVV